MKESPLELERGHVGGSEPSNLAGVAPNDRVLTRARLQLPRSRPVREEKALHAGYFARDDAAFWVALSILSRTLEKKSFRHWAISQRTSFIFKRGFHVRGEIHAPPSGARFHRTGPSEHPSRTRPSQPEHPDRSPDELPPFAKQRRAPPKTRRIPPEASPAAWPRRPPARGAANRPRPGWRAFSSSRSSWAQDRSRESASKPWVAAARRASSSATTHVRETPACAAWNSLSEL